MKPGEAPTVSDASNSPQWRRIVLLVGLAISAGTGLAWSLEHRLHSIPGVLEAEKTVIATSHAVRVRSISVKTGQSVIPGQPLCQLIDVLLEDQLIGKRREIAEYEAEMSRAKAAAEVEIAWRRRELQTEIFEIQLKVAGLSQDKLNKQVEEFAWKDRLSTAEPMMVITGIETSNPFRPVSLNQNQPDDQRLLAMLREDAAAGSAETLSIQIALCEHRLKKLEELDNGLEAKIHASSGVDVAEARLNGSRKEIGRRT